MAIVMIGLNHETAPVEIREQLSFSSLAADSGDPNSMLLGYGGFSEGAVLSTCNRTEVYAVCSGSEDGVEQLCQFLSDFNGLPVESFRGHIYVHRGLDAARHLFSVACGLNSMILGEKQILGQVRDAYKAAAEADVIGKVLHNLFEQALKVGKRAHTETGISENAVSVSYAAVELARKVFRSLKGKRILIIGAGKMSELVGENLAAQGVEEVIVANRTLERGQDLARRFSGRAVPFEGITTWLARVDVVISSTGAPHTVLKKEQVRSAMAARRQRPLFMIDIAVPRDLDPDIHSIDGVYLYDIDDLKSVVEANLRERQREAKLVERIIDEEADSFASWLNSLDAVPIIKSMRGKAEEVRQAELDRAFRKLPDLSDRQRDVIRAMSHLIINKILNEPTVKIKEFASHGNTSNEQLRTVVELFNLGEVSPDSDNGDGDAPEEAANRGRGEGQSNGRSKGRCKGRGSDEKKLQGDPSMEAGRGS